MAKCGVNIPPGLTITTEVCEEFYRVGEFRNTVDALQHCTLQVAVCLHCAAQAGDAVGHAVVLALCRLTYYSMRALQPMQCAALVVAQCTAP
jgi:hypothetical protein